MHTVVRVEPENGPSDRFNSSEMKYRICIDDISGSTSGRRIDFHKTAYIGTGMIWSYMTG